MKNNTQNDSIITFIFGLAVGTMIVTLVFVASCTPVKHKTIEVSALHDVTSKMLVRVQSSEVLPLFGLNTDPMNGATFSSSDMSDVSLNRRISYHLPQGGSAITTNQFDRKREVELFEKNVSTAIDSFSTDTVGREHSSVYLAIAQELNLLSKSPADKKILLVYSDLMENTSELSFYSKQTFALLQSHPETVSNRLFSEMPLEDLSGIEIHFVFQPADAQSDDAFRIVSGFYKKLFESKGATVTISANLSN